MIDSHNDSGSEITEYSQSTERFSIISFIRAIKDAPAEDGANQGAYKNEAVPPDGGPVVHTSPNNRRDYFQKRPITSPIPYPAQEDLEFMKNEGTINENKDLHQDPSPLTSSLATSLFLGENKVHTMTLKLERILAEVERAGLSVINSQYGNLLIKKLDDY